MSNEEFAELVWLYKVMSDRAEDSYEGWREADAMEDADEIAKYRQMYYLRHDVCSKLAQEIRDQKRADFSFMRTDQWLGDWMIGSAS